MQEVYRRPARDVCGFMAIFYVEWPGIFPARELPFWQMDGMGCQPARSPGSAGNPPPPVVAGPWRLDSGPMPAEDPGNSHRTGARGPCEGVRSAWSGFLAVGIRRATESRRRRSPSPSQLLGLDHALLAGRVLGGPTAIRADAGRRRIQDAASNDGQHRSLPLLRPGHLPVRPEPAGEV